jgi:hypothetical protein
MNARFTRLLLGSALATTLATVMSTTARADDQTVKLIQLLIQKGIVSPGQAKDLLKETAPAPRGRKSGSIDITPSEAPPPATPGQIHVTYVPEFIRKQIADQVRAEVMGEAQQEGWAEPDTLPEWTRRIKIYGDLRMRYQGDFYDNGNYDKFYNFNGLNAAPIDLNSNSLTIPYLNTTEDRNRFRLRARLGAEAEIDDWISANIRVGTGQDNGPVSPNQTLGSVGDFGKPALWLDRAFFTLKPLSQVTVYAGRMNNPYLPSDLMFYPELGFDGAAAKLTQGVGGGVTLFGTLGGFPISNTAFDFSTDNSVKYSSRDSYLTGAQAGASWAISPQYTAQLGIGIFDFLGVQGAVSSPCVQQTNAAFYCDTDTTRPPFVQFGNTLYAIRNIVPNGTTTPPNPQYFGLASKFNVLDVHPRFEIDTYAPIDIALEGEFIKNLAYNRSQILTHGPANGPIGPQNNLGNNGLYQGGDTGYMFKATLGDLQINKRWDWNVSLSYRYLETDSTLDSIDDSDFHEGGTNARGYIIGGSVGIARNTSLSLRWLSSQVISGPAYGVDSVQFDLLSSF